MIGNGAAERYIVPLRAVTIGATLLLAAPASVAAPRFVDNILVSRSGGTSTVRIELACPMRLQSSRVRDGGTVVRIGLGPLGECDNIGDSSGEEAYRPPGGAPAHLTEVDYEPIAAGQSFLVLHFDRAVGYHVDQGADLRSLELRVRPPDAAQPEAHTPKTEDDYIVNLQSTRRPVSRHLIASLPHAAKEHVYISNIDVDGETWHRLRLGFFASEVAAAAVMKPLKKRFPRAWVGRAGPRERRAVTAQGSARGASIDAGRVGRTRDAAAAKRSGGPDAAAAPPAAGGSAKPLGRTHAAVMFSEARSATLDGNFPAAIRLYTRLLQMPGTQQAKARELLGVAYEKNGQSARAEAEYRAYLERYPSGAGAARVRQRLNELITADTAGGRAPDRTEANNAVADRPRWNVTSDLSQYYRRDEQTLDASRGPAVTMSALVSDFDLNVARSGGKLDLLGRFTVNHFYDLLNSGEFGTGTRSRLYYAYLDLATANPGGWSVRLGRQSLHHWGVLGRFDGVHFTYQWAPNRRVHLMTGAPVQSLYSSLTTTQHFTGAAVDFDRLIGGWNFSTFVNRETVDGINDRQAAGFEVSYRDRRRSLNSIVDYDVGYKKLNTVLALGTWRLPQRLTLTMLLDLRQSPVLTTRNALIGQPVTSIDQLLLSYTVDQIRQLAIDRTAQSKTTTLGIAKSLGERFQLNADVTVTDLGGTVASAGVPAFPDLGTQTFYSTSLVASGLFGGNDVTVFNLRRGQSDTFTTDSLTWDARFAVSRHLRINPRLQLFVWEALRDGTNRTTLSPSLRLLLNLRDRYRLEFEAGTSKLTRTQGSSRIIASGNYFDLGYQASFQ